MKRYQTMLGFMIVCAILAMGLAGCATARVTNKATYKVTAPDGTVTERLAENNIFALGDRAVEQNLKGSLADATEADLSAGIQESTQKSESGVVAELVGKGIDAVAQYLAARAAAAPAPTAAPAAAPPPAATVPAAAPAAEAPSLTAYSEDPAPDAKSPGYLGAPSPAGIGVYGRTTCSRCRAYKLAHPEVEMIDLDNPSNRNAMWAALRARGFSGTSVQLPVTVTADGYTQAAK